MSATIVFEEFGLGWKKIIYISVFKTTMLFLMIY